MATLDLVVDAGGKPGVCMNLRHASTKDSSLATFGKRLEQALNVLATDRSITVILMNFLDSISEAALVAEVIAQFISQYHTELATTSIANVTKRNISPEIPHLVVRLVGSQLQEAEKYLSQLQIDSNTLVLQENLDLAISQAIRLTESQVKQNI